VRRPTAFAVAVAAALLALAATAPLAAASPGSGLRGRLTAAVQKTVAAKSLIARATAELRESGSPRVPFLRLEERVEHGPTPKADILRLDPGKASREITNEVLTVGSRAWYRAKAHRYREAKLGPGVVTGFDEELEGIERAIKAGKNLSPLGENRYELVAPSKTINGPEGGSEPIHLTLSLSATGHLTKVVRIDEEGPHAKLYALETFTDFGRSFGIAPPPVAAVVQAPVKEVASKSEFSDLLGPPPFGDD
jgi:hypothetical protein